MDSSDEPIPIRCSRIVNQLQPKLPINTAWDCSVSYFSAEDELRIFFKHPEHVETIFVLTQYCMRSERESDSFIQEILQEMREWYWDINWNQALNELWREGK